ncbi:hypothetical protein HPB48_009263 [Haemaphysalis longicornis]|uniref:Uncharacterized protein n=1 Tax=Haemaphysalis longicornis TaxID=44386 RepID=A0A9J6GGF0_HAELO|nr:hypothetical protein HPB48_009263 [Haemaphysalis longicornis]
MCLAQPHHRLSSHWERLHKFCDELAVSRVWIRRPSGDKYRPTDRVQLDIWATYNHSRRRRRDCVWPASSSTLIWFWPATCCNDHRIHVWPANCDDSFRIRIWSARSPNHDAWIHVWPTSRHYSGHGFWLWPAGCHNDRPRLWIWPANCHDGHSRFWLWSASSSRHWLWRIRCTDNVHGTRIQFREYLQSTNDSADLLVWRAFNYGRHWFLLWSTTTTQSTPFGGSSLFSTGFGTSAAPSFAGAAAPGAAAAASASNIANLGAALSLPTVFNDERDTILAKWNQLQAFWGTGKGYFSATAAPVEFTTENPFCRFKAIGYSRLPEAKVEDGLVALVFAKKLVDVQPMQPQLVEGLHRILGSKSNHSVCVEGLKSLSADKCELVVYVMERSPAGLVRRVPCTELVAFLEQLAVKPQLTTLGVHSVISKAAATKEWLQHYLENPPCGQCLLPFPCIDPLLWEQAKKDNPNPERLIPVPMIGFAELRRRFKLQEHEIKQHQCRLDVMVHHEVRRKLGFAIQPEEEKLRTLLETNVNELSAPTQFRGRLNELMSQIKLQNNQMTFTDTTVQCSLEPGFISQLKEHLQNQQRGISQLVKILKDDMEDLRKIESSRQETSKSRR